MKKARKYITLITFLIFVFLVISALGLIGEFLSITKYQGETIVFHIDEGSYASEVADELEELKVIKSKYTFLVRHKLLPDSKSSVYHGDHIIRKGMSLGDVLKEVTSMPEKNDTITLSIPEGYSAEMIALKAEEAGLCTYNEFIEAMKDDDFDYEFIKHIPDGEYKYKLEGFLFPNTYEFFKDDGAHKIIDKMLSTFEREYKAHFSDYDNMFRLVTIASIVEREAVIDEERPTIAGVIENRLKKDMLLQVDATVVYAKSLGRYDMTKVTYKDLEVSSPYNTYKNKGLTPGPICNAGLKSLLAAAKPESHDWLFYHTDENKADGSHIFTKSFDDHVATMNNFRRDV